MKEEGEDVSYKGTIEFEAKIDLDGFEGEIAKLNRALEKMNGFEVLEAGITSAQKAFKELKGHFDTFKDAGGKISSLVNGFDAAAKKVEEYKSSIQGAVTAEALQTAGITAKEALVGLLTGKIGLVTAAQLLWSAAMAASPFGAVTTVVLAIVAALGALAVALDYGSSKYKAQAGEVKELTQAQKDFAEAAKGSQEASEKNLKAIGDTASDSRRLAATLGELAKGYDRAAGDEQRMATYVAKLNEEQEGLNLTFDEQTGALSMTAEQIGEYIAAKEEMAKAEAYIERENELYREQAEIAENLKLIEQQKQEVENGGFSELQRLGLMHELNESEKEYLAAQEEGQARLAIVKEERAELDTVASQAILDNAQAEADAAAAAAQAAEEEMQRRQEALGTYTEAATNMFDRIKTESELSVGDMIGNLEHNQEAVANWADNLVELGNKGLDQGLLQQLRDAGPEAAGTVAELVTASGDEITRLSELYQNGGEVAVQALLTSLGVPEVEQAGMQVVDDAAQGVSSSNALVEETQAMVTRARDAAAEQVQNSDFASVGRQIMAGIANGINAGKSSVVNAAKEAVRAAMEAAKREGEIRSPSRKTRREIGRPFALGIGLGVEDEADGIAARVTDTMQKLENAAQKGLLGKDGIQGAAQRLAAGIQLNHAQIALAMPQAGLFAMAGPTEAAAAGTASYTQNFNFYQPVETPDETARAIRLQTTYGLAGDVG